VQQFKLVRDRVADIAYVVMGYTPGEFPDSTIFEMPFLVENSLEGSLAHWRMVERGLLRGYDKAKVPRRVHDPAAIAAYQLQARADRRPEGDRRSAPPARTRAPRSSCSAAPQSAGFRCRGRPRR
jgi:hypothetical protein